jgi:hypothetical protein
MLIAFKPHCAMSWIAIQSLANLPTAFFIFSAFFLALNLPLL